MHSVLQSLLNKKCHNPTTFRVWASGYEESPIWLFLHHKKKVAHNLRELPISFQQLGGKDTSCHTPCQLQTLNKNTIKQLYFLIPHFFVRQLPFPEFFFRKKIRGKIPHFFYFVTTSKLIILRALLLNQGII